MIDFKKILSKRTKSQIVNENRIKGKQFEDQQDTYNTIMGRKVEKLHKGPDRKITETDWTGRKKVWYEEYKSSKTAPLRKSQKEFMKKHPGKMKVIRPSESFSYDEPQNPKRKRKSKSKKRQKTPKNDNYGFNMDNVFGSGNHDVWGGF
jgi:hypothetical protein